jgi:hypothetical protein
MLANSLPVLVAKVLLHIAIFFERVQKALAYFQAFGS